MARIVAGGIGTNVCRPGAGHRGAVATASATQRIVTAYVGAADVGLTSSRGECAELRGCLSKLQVPASRLLGAMARNLLARHAGPWSRRGNVLQGRRCAVRFADSRRRAPLVAYSMTGQPRC